MASPEPDPHGSLPMRLVERVQGIADFLDCSVEVAVRWTLVFDSIRRRIDSGELPKDSFHDNAELDMVRLYRRGFPWAARCLCALYRHEVGAEWRDEYLDDVVLAFETGGNTAIAAPAISGLEVRIPS